MHRSMMWFRQIAQESTTRSHAHKATAFHFFTSKIGPPGLLSCSGPSSSAFVAGSAGSAGSLCNSFESSGGVLITEPQISSLLVGVLGETRGGVVTRVVTPSRRPTSDERASSRHTGRGSSSTRTCSRTSRRRQPKGCPSSRRRACRRRSTSCRGRACCTTS